MKLQPKPKPSTSSSLFAERVLDDPFGRTVADYFDEALACVRSDGADAAERVLDEIDPAHFAAPLVRRLFSSAIAAQRVLSRL